MEGVLTRTKKAQNQTQAQGDVQELQASSSGNLNTDPKVAGTSEKNYQEDCQQHRSDCNDSPGLQSHGVTRKSPSQAQVQYQDSEMRFFHRDFDNRHFVSEDEDFYSNRISGPPPGRQYAGCYSQQTDKYILVDL
jgi:hypothetical protein